MRSEPTSVPTTTPAGLQNRTERLRWPGLLAVSLLLAAVAAARLFDGQTKLEGVLGWISAHGTQGMVVFVLLYVAACVLMLPGSLLTLGAGALFGLAQGLPLVSLSATLGATVAFLVSRHLAREWVARKLANHPRFAALDQAVAREGWKIVLLTRLSPAFPFSLLNYAFGLTSVALRDYVLASWIGMMPGTVLYVYLGSLAGDVARLGSETRPRAPLEWAWYAVGFAVTVAVTVYVTRLARRSLSRKLDREPSPS